MYKQAIFDITNRCNISCKHCYATSKYGNRGREDLSLDNVFSIIDTLKGMGYTHVLFLGGEPLFRNDILKIIEYTTNSGLKVMINTNGILLSDEMCKSLLKLNIDQISVSFEGTTSYIHDQIAGIGNFKKSLTGLNNLINAKKELKSNVFIGIQYTISKIALDDACNVLEFSIDNAEGININFLDEIGNAHNNQCFLGVTTDESIDFIEKVLDKQYENNINNFVVQIPAKKMLIRYLNHKYKMKIEEGPIGYKCSAGEKVILIESDGIVTPCGIANNLKYQNSNITSKLKHQCLNILNYSLESQLHSTEYFKNFLELKKKNINVECIDCEYNLECSPCPINPKNDLLQCQSAKRRYMNYLDSIMDLQVHLAFDKIEGLPMNESARYVIEMFSKGYTMSDVIRLIVSATNKEKALVVQEIIDFHYYLSIHKLVLP